MDLIEVLNATQNNLRGVSVAIPVGKITTFTGVSGSGKSSLVFGVLAAESQRQLNFTYPAYVRNRLPHGGTPQVDHISGLSTAIIIDQKAIGTNNRSTVGTATDAAPLLRLIMSRMGKPFVGYSNIFSFNDPAGMCPRCKGLGVAVDVDENELIDLDRSINEGAFTFSGYAPGTWYWKWYKRTGLFDADRKLRDYSKEDLDTLLYAEPTPLKNPPPDWYATAKYEGVIHRFRRMYLGNASDTHKKRFAGDLERIIHQTVCPDCKGARLNPLSLSCRIDGQNIDDLCRMSINDLRVLVEGWCMPEVAPAVENLTNQLRTLVDLGLGYLQLGRGTTTLSGGEAQRIKMVRHLGSSLTRFTYILDEPSTGLHPRDVRHLGDILKRLRDKGNTVLLVEHDPDLIDIADFVVDMGPGPGAAGGKILFSGPLAELRTACTPTGEYLRAKRDFTSSRIPHGDPVKVRNARRNNLQGIDVDIPRNVLTALTGVAGSGKSSLIKEILTVMPSALVIDQSPLRGSTTSTVATYTGVMERIRDLFARSNGVSRSWFTNASKGACPVCKGRGVIVTELAFLDSTEMTCEACNGTGFNETALGYRFEYQSIADILTMSVDQAAVFLAGYDKDSAKALDRLRHVGLGYLTIGRSTSTLSGGERQRVKLATLLDEDVDVLILDEPTTGLHGMDVTRLLAVISGLVDRDVTVLMVEHNLDAMLASDWIIDLGPDAGAGGGRVMYAGPASQIIEVEHTFTGDELRRYVKESPGKSRRG
ncbi:excinuclease ABC subunit A [Gluconobacter oxydans]|uniref:ATP-binding cassette domain-containing protein n=1 Tax=Gluconobacter thailandicus TaxID=257438 RepID=UPI0002998831|nr:excinuclease ABC subunit UvrA [Gluconobacter thailandicus]AFW02640.1 excinuclease ABC subunit A [Gluconobacter oxydans H24]ANQ41884.1 excinuclease ABC subunit A [Gluconobacter oxydans]